MVEIGLERVEEGDELGMYHIVYIRQIDASHRFVHPPPKRIHVTVCQRQEAGLLRPADFTMVRDDIVAELRLRKQERLDLQGAIRKVKQISYKKCTYNKEYQCVISILKGRQIQNEK